MYYILSYLKILYWWPNDGRRRPKHVAVGKKKGSHVWWIVNNWFLKIPQTKVCTLLTFWHWSFTFNSNKSPTWCNSFSVYYPDICLQLNMFRVFSCPSSVAQWLQWQPLVLPSHRGDSRAVFVVGPAGPTTNTARLSPRYEGKTRGCHNSHWAAVDGRKTPETCW
jgi:hypothetical protein